MSTCIPAGRCGVDFEYTQAACDVKRNIDQYGGPIVVRLHQESTVDRDRYNTIKNRTPNATELEINALPINFSPTSKQKSDAGIREDVKVMVTTAMQDWINASVTIEDLNLIKADVILAGSTYELVDKSLRGQLGVNFLYVVLGLNRR